jgi:carboxyl-terminal processing protease
MINVALFFLSFVVLFFQSCFGLEGKKIHSSMEEMLEYHVEYKSFSPLLAKRSFKLFIDQFDPHKTYLLESEASSYLNMSEKKLNKVVSEHELGGYSVYEELNLLAQKSIIRARGIREDIYKELLVSEKNEVKEESEDSFAGTEEKLREKIKEQVCFLLKAEQELEKDAVFSASQKQRIFDLWEKRFRRIENPYLQEGDSLLEMHILKAFAKSLDAHSSFFSQEEAYDLRTSLEKQFEGIGVVLREGIHGIAIKNLIKNGPAEKSGKIEIGDVLVAINGQSVLGVSYDEVLQKLKGERGEKVSLVFSRLKAEKDQEFDVELIREKILLEEERVRGEALPFGKGIIGIVEVPSFYESGDGSSCEKDLKEAIRRLRSQGDLLGMILDMRENSGGFLTQAVKVASLFISSGIVVVSKYAEDQRQYLRNTDGRVFYQGPLVVLTSKASASAAEIVAQALQDYGIAIVVGDERTYGKGSIQYQTVTEDDASSYFKVTVGKYYTVSGRSTQIEGVKADIVVPTAYAPFNIGEKYLSYPLKNDQIEASFVDPLTDIGSRSKSWMQKNYLPHVQKKLSVWTEMIPILKANSDFRIHQNKDFLTFFKLIEKAREDESTGDSKSIGLSDLQMQEAVHIVKDMKLLEKYKKRKN